MRHLGRKHHCAFLVITVAVGCAVAWFAHRATLVAPMLTLSSPSAGYVQVFYSGRYEFQEEQSVQVAVTDRVTRLAALRADRQKYFRIDPPGDIDGLEVCSTNDAYQFEQSHQLTVEYANGCWRLHPDAHADDPSVTLSLRGKLAHSRALKTLGLIWRTALVVAVLAALALAYHMRHDFLAHAPLVARIERRLDCLAPNLFALALVVFGAGFAIITPPGGVPDEYTHLRASVSLYEKLFPECARPSEAATLGEYYGEFGNPLSRAPRTFEGLRNVLSKPVSCGKLVNSTGGTESPYLPHFYLFGALVLRGISAIHGNFGEFLILTRFLNLVTAAVLIWLGMRYARLGRWSIGCVAILPMAVSQMASVSADSLTIATGLGYLGVLSGYRFSGRREAGNALWLTIFTVLLALSKPGSAWLLGALVIAPFWSHQRMRTSVSEVVALVAIPMLVHLGAIVGFAGKPLIRPGVDLQANALTLKSNPSDFLEKLVAAFHGPSLHSLWDMLIGRLGWLDIGLPHWCYLAATAALWASIAVNRDASVPGPIARAVAFVLAAAAITTTAVPLYLTWTLPDSAAIDGVQGRYFLVLVAFILLYCGRQVALPARFAAASLALVLPIINTVAIYRVYERYYWTGS